MLLSPPLKQVNYANSFLPAGLPRSSKLLVLNLLAGQNQVFAQQGRLVAPIHVRLGVADGHVGPLGFAKFHLNRHREGGNAAPKYQKFPLSGKVPSQGRTL